MQWLAVIFGALAAAAWLSAVVHGLWSLAHLSGRTSLGSMLFRGIEWFNPENFSERGRALQRRFGWSFAAFFAAVLGAILCASLLAR